MGELYLIITIDAENLQTPFSRRLYTQDLIYNDQDLGVPQILELTKQFSCPATFFLNVFEHRVWGNERMAWIASEILEAGGDVQLHTHPVWSFDSRRKYMWEYSLGEQIEIIRRGKELVNQWIGKYPIAHRAGAYGLDQNTLVALRENNIPIDSSMFYTHPNCKITWSRNKVVEKSGVIEVPITGFYRDRCWKVGPVKIKKDRAFVKTDVNWASLGELRRFVEEAKKSDIRVVNLFMHSYSLIKWNEEYTIFEPDDEDIEKFMRLLEFVRSDRDIEVITMREFYKRYKRDPKGFIGSDYVPVFKYEKSLGESIRNRLKRISK